MEIWKDVYGYEGIYEVSNKGEIRRSKDKYIMKQYDKNGYARISLTKNGKSKNHYVHRVVAKAFIPNPENKSQIDHIDTNRANNAVENLKWATVKENNNNPITKEKLITYMKANPRILKNRNTDTRKATEALKRKVICTTTGKEFSSIKEAREFYNIKNNEIISVCKGKRNYCGKLEDGTNLKWMYA